MSQEHNRKEIVNIRTDICVHITYRIGSNKILEK
jgi:hypothetical protein